MRILEMTPYFPPYVGGQEKYILNLSKQLVKNGHEVWVATSNYPKGKREEEIDGVHVIRFPCLARPLRNPITPQMHDFAPLLKDFDVVHTHNEHSYAAMLSSRMKRKTGVPLVLTCHGQLRFDNTVYDLFEWLYSRSMGKFVLKATDGVVALSEADHQYLRSIWQRANIKVIPNAIDATYLDKLSKEDDGGQDFNDLDGKHIALFVGQVIKRKGIEYLLRSIPEIVKQMGNERFRCVIVGTGEDLDGARLLARDLGVEPNVIFTGRVSDDVLATLYRMSDLYVLPSLSEGMATTILEAMYYGCPVVTTNIPGSRDNFADTALLVPPRDNGALAEAMVRLMTDETLRENMGKIGKSTVLEYFTWEKVAQRYESMFSTMVSPT